MGRTALSAFDAALLNAGVGCSRDSAGNGLFVEHHAASEESACALVMASYEVQGWGQA